MKKWIKKIKEKALEIRDLPKSIYFNYKCLPRVQAKKLPIRIRWNTKLGNLEKGCVEIKSDNIKYGMIKFGYQGGKFISENNSYISIDNKGKLIFKGNCTIAEGFNICISNGTLNIGENFYANRNLQIECNKNICFGDYVLLGWNVRIRDTDGHMVLINKSIRPYTEEINISNHVWVAADATILKGTYINDGCVIACGSIVCGSRFIQKNCLIAGIPARVKKENIEWIE